jgi:hypothetical protein
LPHRRSAVLLTDNIVAERTERLVAAKLESCTGEGQRRVLEFNKIRQSVRKRLLKNFCRSRAGQMHLGEVARPVCQFDLLRNEISIQVLEDLFGHTRPRIQLKRVRPMWRSAIDDDKGDNLCLPGCQERLAARSRR